MSEKPRLAVLANGPYYLLNDLQASPVPNLVRSSVEAEPPARPPKVLVTDSGPYAVCGGIELMSVEFGEGASREHYTLCRCGASANKPFCDGSHWRIGFKDP